jgi:prepilin-type N-terminal cleavage/methylation domain-containing protein
MPPSNAHNNNQGFTLIESLTIIMIIGVLATIATPSFLSWLSNKKVENALVRVEGALKEAQRQAIARSKPCVVTIPTGVNQQITSTCLGSSDWVIQEVNISRPSSLATLNFDFKGRVRTPGNSGTIILSLPNNTVRQKCLEISVGIGLMRTGTYDGTSCNSL